MQFMIIKFREMKLHPPEGQLFLRSGEKKIARVRILEREKRSSISKFGGYFVRLIVKAFISVHISVATVFKLVLATFQDVCKCFVS